MELGEIVKDFFAKVVAPIMIIWILYSILHGSFTKDGVTNYFGLFFTCGVPFGIWQIRLLVVSAGGDLNSSLGVLMLNIIIGGLIGICVIVWKVIVAAWYLFLTIFRILTYKKDIPTA